MNKMNRYALIATLATFPSGRVTQREPAPVKEVKPIPEQPTQPQQPVPVMLTMPGIPQQSGPIKHEDRTVQPTSCQRHYSWNGAMQPMVDETLQVDDVRADGVLLVDSVNNHTSSSLNVGEATETSRNALANNGEFMLISAQQLAVAKQQLGLSSNGNLGTRSKAIGIVRNIGVQYVLYSNASGDVNSPAL